MNCPTCGNKKISENISTWKTSTCDCYIQNELKTKYDLAKIPNSFWYKTISDLHNKVEEEVITKYVSNFDKALKSSIGLYLYPMSFEESVTPSFIACIILKELLKKGYTGKYVSFETFLSDTAKDYFNKDVIVIDKIDLFDFSIMEPTNYYKFLNLINYSTTPIIFTSQLHTLEGKSKQVTSFRVRNHCKIIPVVDLSSNLSIEASSMDDIFNGGTGLKSIV